ncbi:MAG: radical SAM protein [bacterium]
MTSPYSRRKSFPESHVWANIRTLHHPISFLLELTARCNMNCRHCYVNCPSTDTAVAAREMPRAMVADLARQAVDMGTLWCTLTGGDPLLHPEFTDIYLDLKRLGLLTSVFTNATLITTEHAQLWQAYPPRDVEVTVYGATAESYERVTRRPGSYAAFRRGLDILGEYGVPVHLKAIALRSNYDDLANIAEFCRQYSKDRVRFSTMLHLRTDGDQQRSAEIRAERLTAAEMRASAQAFDDDDCLEPGKKQPAITAADDPMQLFHCNAGIGNFAISYDGQFRLCISLNAPGTTYDLHKGTLRDAWENFVPAVRALRTTADFRCTGCDIRHQCTTCPAFAYLETGALDGVPEYFCQLAHEKDITPRFSPHPSPHLAK